MSRYERNKISATLRRAIFLALFLVFAINPHMAFPAVPAANMSDYTAYPPFITQGAPPAVMLTIAKDHNLFFKAFNDVVDLDGDGVPDITYKDTIRYEGYFDPNKCYSQSGGIFVPVGLVSGATLVNGYVVEAPAPAHHYCSGQWSGNFMNWATMSRMDVIRKVLYGGKRTTDGVNSTVLSRAKTPDDAHAWVKVYTETDLAQLTPGTNTAITICNRNTASSQTVGKMYIEWGNKALGANVSGGYYPNAASLDAGGVGQCSSFWDGGPASTWDLTYDVSVKVCDSTVGLESNCLKYVVGAGSPSYKPSGLMEKYGVDRKGTDDTSDDTTQMYFGLITGSYQGNKSGGVLRSNMGDLLSTEINNTNGTFRSSTSKIISNIDKMEIVGYNYTNKNYDNCGLWATFSEGQCVDYGNPMGEMYFEALRYLMGKKSATTQYDKGDSPSTLTKVSSGNWCNPYVTSSSPSCTGLPWCSKPFALLFGDVTLSYDSDQLNGSQWYSTISSASDTPSVKTLIANSHINDLENMSALSGGAFIGQSGATTDSSCSPKGSPPDFGTVRGLCPDEPTKEGAYYIAGLAHWAHTTGFQNPTSPSDPQQNPFKKVTTYSVAMPSTVPQLEFTVGNGKVQIIPSFKDLSLTDSNGIYSRGQLASFSILKAPGAAVSPLCDAACTTETTTNGYQYAYEIMFDDSAAGNDYDLDIKYRLYVKTGGSTVTVKTVGVYANAGHSDYAGYFISGVVNQGEYLEIGCGGGADQTDCDRACRFNGAQTVTTIGQQCPGTTDARYTYNYQDANVRVCTAATWVNCSGATAAIANAICSAVIPGDTCAAASAQVMSDSTIERTFTVAGTSNQGFLQNPLYYAAKYGGFKDLDGSNTPNLDEEWKDPVRGFPNTYFYASNPNQIESQLEAAFADILEKTSSGTSASVLATTGEGEGALYQAYFYPKQRDNTSGMDRYWLGYIHALFLDPYGNLREDTNGNKTLDGIDPNTCGASPHDYVVQTTYNIIDGTKVNRYNDTQCKGNPADFVLVDTLPIESVHSIWNGGAQLRLTRDIDIAYPGNSGSGAGNDGGRKIYTTWDGFTRRDFLDTSKTTLRPYLRAATDTEAADIINFIRGRNIAAYRKREMGGATWKLGDIVYSTPTAVARPAENYDVLYRDPSYFAFVQKYATRRHVVYVGGNDGVLHAFNGGFFSINDHKFWRGYSGGTYSDGGPQLGDELWGFIPREALPHLKWLTDPNYTHVYYVDLKPKVTDVKMFSCDSTHVGKTGDTTCWGTILIGGMRYGGKSIPIETTGGTSNLRSTYFALDITDPEQEPRLLWTFDTTDTGALDLGLTMSYPSVAKVGNDWYAIFGSGPTNFDRLSNLTGFQNGNVFIAKISGGSNGVITTWTLNSNYWKKPTGHSNAFMASPITVDVNTDFTVDVAYIGESYTQASTKYALMWRLNTMADAESSIFPNPGSWILSALYNVTSANDLSKRFTAAPSAALDDDGKLWVFFGTGQYLGVNDRNTTDTGAFYAVRDGCWNGLKSGCPVTYSNLVDESNVKICVGGGTGCGGTDFNALRNAVKAADGWVIYFKNMTLETVDFLGNTLAHAGERITTKPSILGGLVLFPSYIPGTDVCTMEGTSNLYALGYTTGSAVSTPTSHFIFKKEESLYTGMSQSQLQTKSVSRTALLGKGLPASIGLAVTKEGKLKGFVQSSTGDIQPIQDISPQAPRSGYTGWKTQGLGGER